MGTTSVKPGEDAENLTPLLQQAAEAIRTADALLIGAGAGMGVDSGLPDFRGPEGFWQAYPPFRGRDFTEISTPHWFQTDPGLAWGFFGHRLQLYRSTRPHSGFDILRRWGARLPGGCFALTSNVDGHFLQAGFPAERIYEVHGSIHHLQCTVNCGQGLWSAAETQVSVDESVYRATAPYPECPACGRLARPNILMFGDDTWDETRSWKQAQAYRAWLKRWAARKLVVVELGAGLAVPTIRRECERVGGTHVRINLRDTQPARNGCTLPLRALDALQRLDELLSPDGNGVQ